MSERKKSNPGPATAIRLRIMKLKSLKAEQEDILKHDLKETLYQLTPSAIIRGTVQDFKHDPSFRKAVISKGIGVGAGFLIDAIVFRNGFGLKSSLVSGGIKKALGFLMRKTAG